MQNESHTPDPVAAKIPHDAIAAHLVKKLESTEERTGRHGNDLRRLEQNLEDVHKRITVTHEKFDLRVSTIEHDRRKGNQRLLDKIEDILKNNSSDSDKEIAEIRKKLETISTSISTLSTDYHARHNVLRAALWVVGAVITLSQVLVVTYVREYNTQIIKLQAYDSMNEARESDNRKQTLLIQQQVAQLTELLVAQKQRK